MSIYASGIFSSGSNVSITEGTVDSISSGKYAAFSVTVQVPSDKRIIFCCYLPGATSLVANYIDENRNAYRTEPHGGFNMSTPSINGEAITFNGNTEGETTVSYIYFIF